MIKKLIEFMYPNADPMGFVAWNIVGGTFGLIMLICAIVQFFYDIKDKESLFQGSIMALSLAIYFFIEFGFPIDIILHNAFTFFPH